MNASRNLFPSSGSHTSSVVMYITTTHGLSRGVDHWHLGPLCHGFLRCPLGRRSFTIYSCPTIRKAPPSDINIPATERGTKLKKPFSGYLPSHMDPMCRSSGEGWLLPILKESTIRCCRCGVHTPAFTIPLQFL